MDAYSGRFDHDWHTANPARPPGTAYPDCTCEACRGEAVETDRDLFFRTLADAVISQQQPWRINSACLDEDPNVFVLATQGASGNQARAWCAKCPVARACLIDALANPDPLAIRAGMGGKHRRVLARAWAERTHMPVADCTCESCATINDHLDSLAGKAVPVRVAGRNLTPGLAASYNKGLRDDRSRLAKTDLTVAKAARRLDSTPGSVQDAVLAKIIGNAA